jgi:hypothetical protein
MHMKLTVFFFARCIAVTSGRDGICRDRLLLCPRCVVRSLDGGGIMDHVDCTSSSALDNMYMTGDSYSTATNVTDHCSPMIQSSA